MKMKKKLTIALICVLGLMAMPSKLLAQDDLQIRKVFDKFGHHKNVVMVELSGDMLQSYNLTLYKSISIKEESSAVDFILRCLKKDQEGAKKIKQVVKAGDLYSAYYQLAKKGSDNRFILYKNEDETATLIYIETPIETDNIVNLLLKKGQ